MRLASCALCNYFYVVQLFLCCEIKCIAALSEVSDGHCSYLETGMLQPRAIRLENPLVLISIIILKLRWIQQGEENHFESQIVCSIQWVWVAGYKLFVIWTYAVGMKSHYIYTYQTRKTESRHLVPCGNEKIGWNEVASGWKRLLDLTLNSL